MAAISPPGTTRTKSPVICLPSSPGGWRLIGMTPVSFYDPNREKPVLCEAGDYIRFVPIPPEEYERQIKEGGAS